MAGFQALDFEESGDYAGIVPDPESYHNVPGWASLDDFLRNNLGINNNRLIEVFRKYHNHYLKNFPVHYFTRSSIEGVDYALFFPVRGGKNNGSSNSEPHYLVAISQNENRTVVFHRKLTTSMKTRSNFHRLTARWAEKGFPAQNYIGADIGEILAICERPEDLIAMRARWFSRFLDKLERKLHKFKMDRPLAGKWGQILEFLTERDRQFLTHIAAKMKSEHVNFEAAHAAASVSGRNLDIYNWIMSGDGPQAIHHRTRLTNHYPWLAMAMSLNDGKTHQPQWEGARSQSAFITFPTNFFYQDIEKAVDSGAPLIEALQDLFSEDDPDHPIRQSTIRKTIGLRIGRDYLRPDNIRPALRMIDTHIPHLVLEEGVLERISKTLRDGGRTFDYLSTSYGEVLANVPHDIRMEMLGDDSGSRIKDYNDTTDYMDRIFNTITLPYFAHRAHKAERGGLTEAIKSYLSGSLREETFFETEASGSRLPPILRPYGNMMFHNLVKLSVYWHNHRGRSYDSRYYSINIDKNARWPKLTENVVAPNGVTITPHGSKSDLLEDFKKFGTCIDGYSTYCLGLQEREGMEKTYSHASRIATKDKDQEATLVVLEPYDSRGFKRQVTFFEIDGKRRVYETRDPPDKNSPLSLAAHWYVAAINRGEIAVDWDRIDKQRKANNGESIRLQTGFDYKDYEKCASAYYAMRPFLPERHRHLEYEEWIAKMGFDRDADILFGVAEKDLSLKELNKLDFG
ncbi:MAG: hypothetical protein DI551_09700 [Micavibrio aeruginosavorus]|uniref:Uncharacterized protein n=1 Tax=Micavibrio aeruginosavorus TaxID=349221 RepID=A0A2W5MV28_9BACT|nr:MAG: hypothetical protein DI551_09700 [Micavibrio aeruginosavorus]